MINTIGRKMSFIALGGILACAPMSAGQAASQSQPEEVKITGTVTCSKYVYSKPERKGFSTAEAIRLCASQGYSYVIVSGKNVYPIEGDRNKLAKLAGEKVTVTGHIDTDQPTGAAYTYHATVGATTIAPSTN